MRINYPLQYQHGKLRQAQLTGEKQPNWAGSRDDDIVGQVNSSLPPYYY